MTDRWSLKRTTQCAKCPWKVSTDPRTIPRGYSEEQHRALAKTIAEPGALPKPGRGMSIMACHDEHEAHCVGWVYQQMGPGNNLALRIALMSCDNIKDLRVIGEQHETFEDTLP